MPVHVGKGAAAWNAVLRVLGDLEWPCRLYIFLPCDSDDNDDDDVRLCFIYLHCCPNVRAKLSLARLTLWTLLVMLVCRMTCIP